MVAGNDAQKFAEIFHVETRRPTRNGLLNPLEPHSFAVVKSIIEKLVGRTAAEEQSFALNGLTDDRVRNVATIYCEDVISNLVRCLNDRISAAHCRPKLDWAIPLVISGGTASLQGSLNHFGKAMRDCNFRCGPPSCADPLIH
jgi:hypothetical protein